MFLMVPCPTIKDNVKFILTGQLAKNNPSFNDIRKVITQLSDTQNLINRIQNGQLIMQHKIKFDNYLKSHVQLMKLCAMSHMNCQFKYNSFAIQDKTIDTTLMSIKQQWGLQIIMTRFILSSVYLAGAFTNIGGLFNETAKSYVQGYSNTSEFSKNLQITFRYLSQGFDPLRRLYPVIDSVQQLFSKQILNQHIETNANFFKFFRQLYQVNLAYVKIEKYRILCQYRSCKQSAWAVYQRLKQLKAKLINFSSYNISQDIISFINLGIVFYKTYSLYSLLLQNQNKKTEQEYGFIKKQFQQMIYENLVIADQIINLKTIAQKLPGQQLDNVMFANQVMQAMVDHAEKTKYRYNIDLHQTKIQKPNINNITMKIISKNIWDNLMNF